MDKRNAISDKSSGIVWDPLRPNERLKYLDYADDKFELTPIDTLTCKSELSDLAAESAKLGTKINANNTMEMQINQETSAPLTLDGNPIQQIDKFQYLVPVW